jgi:hypothetical protein
VTSQGDGRYHISYVDFDPAQLLSTPLSFDELLTRHAGQRNEIQEFVFDTVPRDAAWTPLAVRHLTDSITGEYLATQTKTGGWAVAALMRNEAEWILSIDPGPFPLRSSAAARETGLSLTWTDRAVQNNSGRFVLPPVQLTNTSAMRWSARGRSPQVSAVVSRDLTASAPRFSMSAGGEPLRDLAASETTEIDVVVDEELDLTSLAPGDVLFVQAVMSDPPLMSDVMTLRVGSDGRIGRLPDGA